MRKNKTVALKWDSFMAGEVEEKNAKKGRKKRVNCTGALEVSAAALLAGFAPVGQVSAAVAGGFSGDTSWADYLIPMLEHQGLPLATLMGVWACLELIVNRTASAIEKLKWAILGLIALMIVPSFIHHIGMHHMG